MKIKVNLQPMARKIESKAPVKNPLILCDQESPKQKVRSLSRDCVPKTKCNFTKLKIIKRKDSSNGPSNESSKSARESMDSNEKIHMQSPCQPPKTARNIVGSYSNEGTNV